MRAGHQAIAAHAGQLRRRFRRSHTGNSLTDHVIAATAILTDRPLSTLNVKHFPALPGLEAPFALAG